MMAALLGQAVRGAGRQAALRRQPAAGHAGAGARPRAVALAFDRPGVFPAEGERRARVAILPGCAQQVLTPEINEATIRLLTRHGVEVVSPRARAAAARSSTIWAATTKAHGFAKRNIDAWIARWTGRASTPS